MERYRVKRFTEIEVYYVCDSPAIKAIVFVKNSKYLHVDAPSSKEAILTGCDLGMDVVDDSIADALIRVGIRNSKSPPWIDHEVTMMSSRKKSAH